MDQILIMWIDHIYGIFKWDQSFYWNCCSYLKDTRYQVLKLTVVDFEEETELDTPEVDTSSHFGNTRSRCIQQYPELGTPDLSTPELDTTLQFQK